MKEESGDNTSAERPSGAVALNSELPLDPMTGHPIGRGTSRVYRGNPLVAAGGIVLGSRVTSAEAADVARDAEGR